ncbi:hypothetical protein [Psychrobacter jeotgali]|uniref:hypothetical protein n=1 Tax=Psychrobacter jeotgali TaxID=179010 RepID=UPI00191960EF|nr:hypothetical protein [Psychrobacter jeotgali]
MVSSSIFDKPKSHLYRLSATGCLVAALAVTGCQSSAENNAVISSQQNNNSSTPIASDISQQTITQQASRIQRALANNDYARIVKDIHPTRGVRFSMYAYVRPESDKVFTRAQFAQYLQEPKIRFTWGALDGTGEPLVIPLPEYLDTWVDASTFNESTPSINEFKHSGNMINNINKIYQNSDFVEFYYKGTEEYAGMDWRIMRLVFDEYQGQRYLVAIVNEQWTT